MRTGGKKQKIEAMYAIRLINVLLAPSVSLYAIFLVSGIIQPPHVINIYGLIVVVYLWLIVSLYYYFRPTEDVLDRAFRLVTIHALMFAICLVAIGFSHPFLLVFSLLFLEAYLLFGKRGLFLSVASFVSIALLNLLLWQAGSIEYAVSTGISVLAVVFVGVAMVRIVSAQETSRQVLLHSQERERLQYDRMVTIINNLSDASFTTDVKGNVLIYNAACLNLLDTNDNLHGKPIGELFNLHTVDGDPVDLHNLLKDASRTVMRDDITHTYSDGEVMRLEITYSPIRSSYSPSKRREREAGYIVLMRDVTKQKSLEEQRDEFISVVSHELRTPITIVEGTLSNLDLILKQPHEPSKEMLASTVTTAHEQVLYLARMVNDLSTLSRAERGVADAPEEIDVAELLQSMHTQYEHDAIARGLHLDIDLGPKLGKVNVSRLYLEELLQNFITNGIKYTKEGSVTIIAARKGNKITFAVKDTGIGISRGDQQKVFDKFYRSEDYRIRETNGTGLGLYVSAKLARKLQTRIELKSRLNHGSTFSFELPVE